MPRLGHALPVVVLFPLLAAGCGLAATIVLIADSGGGGAGGGAPVGAPVGPLPDLVATSVTVSTPDPVEGCWVDLEIGIANRGAADAAAFVVWARTDLDGDGALAESEPVFDEAVLQALPSGADSHLFLGPSSSNYAVPPVTGAGSYRLGATVDAGLDVEESSEANDRLTDAAIAFRAVTGGPDLCFAGMPEPSRAEYRPGETLGFDARFTNCGDAEFAAPAPQGWLVIWALMDASGIIVMDGGNQVVDSGFIGESVPVDYTVSLFGASLHLPAGLPPGEYLLLVICDYDWLNPWPDPNGLVTEVNEENNQALVAIVVR